MTGHNIAAIGVDEALLERISPSLRRQALVLEGAVTTARAIDLCSKLAFDVILVRDPLPGLVLDEFLRNLHRPGSASDNGRVIILADDPTHPRLDEARQREIVVLSASGGGHSDLARRVLRVEPRVVLRVLVRLETHSGQDTTVRMCQSENVSSSGMLIHMEERLSVGQHGRLEFPLRGGTKPIRAEFEVARHSTPSEITGIAVRYVSMEDDDVERLRDRVETLLLESPPKRAE